MSLTTDSTDPDLHKTRMGLKQFRGSEDGEVVGS